METTEKKYTPEELKAMLAKAEAEERKKEQEAIKEYESEKAEFLTQAAHEFRGLNTRLTGLKEAMIREANHLYDRMYEVKGKEPKEVKSFQLKNEHVRVTVERQERFEFTEEALVHINEIKQIFHNKFAQRNKGLYEILEGLLIKGTKGEYDPKLLAKARVQVRALGDQNLIEEFDKLDECQRISGTAMYCRVHVKDDHNKWKELSLNFSSL